MSTSDQKCDETIAQTNATHSNVDSNNTDSTKEKSGSPTFAFSESPSLEQIRRLHQQFVTERDWDKYHSPRNILLALVGEVGELAELFQWRDDAVVGLPDWTASDRQRVEHELSDVLIYLIRLADRCRIDLPNATTRKLELNAIKYPIDKVYGSSKKYDQY